jgi:O-antigen ligase
VAVRLEKPDVVSALLLAMAAALTGVVAGINPVMAIGGALAIAFGLFVFADLAVGVVVFTLLTYFELLPGLSGPALSFTKVAGLVLALSWLARIATRGDAGNVDFLRDHPRVSTALLLFLAWAGLSFFWAESQRGAAEAFYRFVLNAILFLIVYTAIRTPRDAVRVVAAFVIGATAAVAYAYLAGGVDPGAYGEAARLSGDTQNANELASTLVAALVLALAMALTGRSPLLRLASAGCGLIAMTGIFLTVSRAGMIALGVALLAAVIFGGPWRGRVALLAASVGAAAVFYFAVLAPPEARERIVLTEGGTGRVDIWKVGWRMFEAEPVHGVGAGNFQVSSIHFLLEPGALERSDFIVDTPKVAHNLYLGLLAELGVIGLVLFMALIIGLLYCSLRAARVFGQQGNLQMEVLARAQLVGIFALLASMFFSSDEFKKQLWLLLSLGPALLAIAEAGLRAQGTERDEPDPAQDSAAS